MRFDIITLVDNTEVLITHTQFQSVSTLCQQVTAVDFDNVGIHDRDSRWFEQGVQEVVHIKANKPSLNKDGGWYKLSGVYEAVMSNRLMPDTTSYITHSLIKEGVSTI